MEDGVGGCPKCKPLLAALLRALRALRTPSHFPLRSRSWLTKSYLGIWIWLLVAQFHRSFVVDLAFAGEGPPRKLGIIIHGQKGTAIHEWDAAEPPHLADREAEDGRIPNKKRVLFMTFAFMVMHYFLPATVARAVARTGTTHSDWFRPMCSSLHAMQYYIYRALRSHAASIARTRASSGLPSIASPLHYVPPVFGAPYIPAPSREFPSLA
jgi:hypothetical protein